MPLTTADLLDAYDEHTAGFIAAVAAAPADATVPSCPDWDVAELAWHVGWLWDRSSRMAAEGWDVDDVKTYEMPEHPVPEDLGDWLEAQRSASLERFREADPATEVWNWTRTEQHAAWWVRRMVHETWMHRLDAMEVVGDAPPIAPALAADGVAEFHPNYWMRGRRGALDGVVALEASDTGDRWVWAKRAEDGALVASDTAPTATVTGPAAQLLRWIWRRPADVAVTGDGDVATQLQGYCFRD